MTTLVLAHGGAGGLLVESILLVVPVVTLGILTARKHGKQALHWFPWVGSGVIRGSAPLAS